MNQLPLFCQRWRGRRDTYRPAGEPIDPSRYGVELLDGDGRAKDFVVEHHYSGTYPAARCRVGLYEAKPWRAPALVGVAVFSVPMSTASLRLHLGTEAGVELGRFVLLDEVPANGETWFLARALRLLQEALPDVEAVLSFSDPLPRRTAAGRLVSPGHVGTIYQASNARHVGRSKARRLWLRPDGGVVGDRALVKLRKQERGAAAAYRSLLEAGAPAKRSHETWPAYVTRALGEGPFTQVAHPGNLAYAFALNRRAKRSLPPGRPYPCGCESCRRLDLLVA